MNVQVIYRTERGTPHSFCGQLIGIGADGATIQSFGDNGPPSGLAPRVREIAWGNVVEVRTWHRPERRAGDVLYRPASVLEGSRT